MVFSPCNCSLLLVAKKLLLQYHIQEKMRIQPLPRVKFNVEITDATRLIPATVFAEKAKELYNITTAEMVNNTTLLTWQQWCSAAIAIRVALCYHLFVRFLIYAVCYNNMLIQSPFIRWTLESNPTAADGDQYGSFHS